ncbi:MAG: hypothetical protein ACYSOH_03820, partial [Planctomycetota bacterium]
KNIRRKPVFSQKAVEHDNPCFHCRALIYFLQIEISAKLSPQPRKMLVTEKKDKKYGNPAELQTD